MMTQPKRIKLITNNKDTRWDRIRKKYCSNFSKNFKSDAVKKLIEIDYIGKHQQKMLNESSISEKNLDPVLVMNLRHEMFKKIPHKLPIATIAYSKNLQQCKDHNLAVENRYIENQLNDFRKQLEKRHEKNKLPIKELRSFIIDNTEIINDIYDPPIDTSPQVNEFFTGQLEKNGHVTDNNLTNKYLIESENEYLQNDSENVEDNNITLSDQKNAANEIIRALNIPDDRNLKKTADTNSLNFMVELNNEMNLLNEAFEFQLHLEQRASNSTEYTNEDLQPLLNEIENLSLRFNDDFNVCYQKREESICSSTSDDSESVISDIAEEALNELQQEEDLRVEQTQEQKSSDINKKKKNLGVNESSLHNDLLLTVKVVPLDIPLLKDQMEISEVNSSIHRAMDYSNKTNILRNHFFKWRHYVTMEKIQREHVDARASQVKKINVFMNQIRLEKNCLKMENESHHKKNKEKKEVMEDKKANKKYQNRIKVQQDIIDLQRLKLERQERMIMELKLHKMSEEAKEARQEIKNELKTVIKSGDPKSKAKAKCLQLIGDLKDEDDDDYNSLRGRSLLMPNFLQNMHERALERSIRHEQAKQRRLQLEAEKEAQKLALEEAKRLEDEETKRLRLEALKEKRRQEKLAKIIKEREQQKYIENLRIAHDFYIRNVKRIGMEGFKQLLELKIKKLKKCDQIRRSLYKKTYFQAWFSLYHILTARRNQKADEFYIKCLKRKYIQMWVEYIQEERCKYNVAVDFNELKLIELMFQKWLAYSKRMQMIAEIQMKQAISHHEWHLRWKVLGCWQRLPQILQFERETEKRRQRWRLKIWELLPDYKPNIDDGINDL